jgi:hypothetical protein
MRKVFRLVGLAVATSCGGRTGLLADVVATDGGEPAPVPRCTAALLSGAPTPTRGYCPTRANQATLPGPRSPQIAWSAKPFPVDDPEQYLPPEVVVDPAGRAYVAIAPSPANGGGASHLNALDPDGSIAWTASFASPVTDLSLGADGTLWFLEEVISAACTKPATEGGCNGSVNTEASGGVVHGLSSSGAAVATLAVAIPQDEGPHGPSPLDYGIDITRYDSLALGSDGSFFLGATWDVGASQSLFARLSPTSASLLSACPRSPFGPNLESFLGPLLLAPDDTVVVDSDHGLSAFDADCNRRWSADASDVVAIDAQGNTVELVQSPGDGSIELVSLGPAGTVTRVVPFDLTDVALEDSKLALAAGGTDVVLLVEPSVAATVTTAHLTVAAIEPSGGTRWSTGLDASLAYDPAAGGAAFGLFVDAAGTVVVTAGALWGLDGTLGLVRWTLQPPEPHVCLRPAVLGAGGSVLATQCDGTVFLARDP